MVTLRTLLSIAVYYLTFRTTTADSMNVRRCYCVSPTEIGYVTTYNWTLSDSKKYSWERHDTRDRNDNWCPYNSGIQCTKGDDNDCWKIPEVQCYKGFTEAALPYYVSDACVDVEGKRICANSFRMDVDGRMTLLPQRAYPIEKLLDCSEECSMVWPEKNMRSACSHRNVNKKSKHYGQDVPSGWHWEGKKLWEDGINGYGMQATCVGWNYPRI